MKRPATFMQVVLGIVLGMGIGAGVALVLGSGGLWLAVGLALGIAIGAAMSRNARNIHNEKAMTSDRRLTTN
jgi:hypothetical protein